MEHFVSFVHANEYGSFGFGSTVVTLRRPLDAATVDEIREFIDVKYPGEQVVILAFHQLHPAT